MITGGWGSYKNSSGLLLQLLYHMLSNTLYRGGKVIFPRDQIRNRLWWGGLLWREADPVSRVPAWGINWPPLLYALLVANSLLQYFRFLFEIPWISCQHQLSFRYVLIINIIIVLFPHAERMKSDVGDNQIIFSIFLLQCKIASKSRYDLLL